MHKQAAINTAKIVLGAIAGTAIGIAAVKMLTLTQLGICLAVGALAGMIYLTYSIEKSKAESLDSLKKFLKP